LAAHAAQVWQGIAGGKTSAIDDESRWRIDAEVDRHAAVLQQGRQRRQGPARIEMGLVGKEQRAAEPADKIGFKPGNSIRVEPIEAFGARSKARQLARIACRRYYQAAVLHRAGEPMRPPGDRRLTEFENGGVGGGALAPWRQHAARHPRAASFTQT